MALNIQHLVYKGAKANLPAAADREQAWYLTTDTKELFFGADQYAEAVHFYSGSANKPAAPAQGVLYIDDTTGLGEVWDGSAWKVAFAKLTAADNSVTIGGTATAPTIAAKISGKDGNRLAVITETGKEGLFVAPGEDPDTYKIEEAATADTGYLKTYVLNKYPNGDEGETPTVCGKVNIPRDYLVKSASVKTVATEDDPYTGAKVGDKYIDFVINVKDTDTAPADEHIYIPVKDIFTAYEAGQAIEIDGDNKITVKIDATNANGLGKGDDGLKLDLATAHNANNNTTGGKAGAMSADDKTDHDAMVVAMTVGTF